MSAAFARAAVGHTWAPRVHRVDQALVDRYATVSGDRNPLHTDPAFAVTTHFGRTIAHGMMTLAFVSAAMQAWTGSAWVTSGRIDVTFLAPVFPGDEVTVRGEVTSIAESGEVTVSLACTVADRTVLAGTATVARHGSRE